MGFALPAALLRTRCALTAPFHPYLAVACPAVSFSVALSVKSALSEPPRPLAGMLPYGDRTFLPPAWVSPRRPAAAHPAGPHSLSGLQWPRGNTEPENSDQFDQIHPSVTKHV